MPTTDHSAARRRERMLASPRYNGRVFVNTHPISSGLRQDVERPTMRDFLCGGERRTPSGPLPLADPRDTWRTRPESGLRVTWLGHSSLLIEIDGARVLTDPVWGQRVSPMSFAGPKRFHPPVVALDDVPPIDVVVISHDHYDHLDAPTIRKLARTQVPFVTSLGVGAHLERWGVTAERITELDWWEEATVRGLTITAAPAQHFSGRGLKDRNATLWSSFLLRGDTHSFFYGADTGLTTEYEVIRQRLGTFDMVALEIGAWHPSWGDIHMGPENAVKAYEMLGSGVLLPVHWGTFNLAMHPWDEPAETFLRAATAAGVSLAMPRIGAPVEPTRLGVVEPWWRTVARVSATPAVEPREPVAGDKTFEWLPD